MSPGGGSGMWVRTRTGNVAGGVWGMTEAPRSGASAFLAGLVAGGSTFQFVDLVAALVVDAVAPVLDPVPLVPGWQRERGAVDLLGRLLGCVRFDPHIAFDRAADVHDVHGHAGSSSAARGVTVRAGPGCV